MLQKNKVFALGLLLVSGVIQTSFASDKPMDDQKLVVSKLAKKLKVRYDLPNNGFEAINEGVSVLIESPELIGLLPQKKLEVHRIICDHYDPKAKKQEKLSGLVVKLKPYEIKLESLKKLDQGVAELKKTSKYKALPLEQKSDVHATIIAATTSKCQAKINQLFQDAKLK